MTWATSSSFRLAVLVAILPITLAVLGVLIAQSQLRAGLETQAQLRLHSELQALEALYDQRRIVALRQAIEFRSLDGTSGGNLFLLGDRQGGWLAGNLAKWPEGVAQGTQGFAEGPAVEIAHEGAQYLVAARDLRGGFPLLVGVNLSAGRATFADMRAVVLSFGAAMLIGSLLAAWSVSRVARARLMRVNSFLDRIGASGDWQDRLKSPPHQASELAMLDTHVNAMLDRVAHLFAAHQRLGNAVAHEMRTPLARIQNRLAALDLDAADRAAVTDEIRSTIRVFDSLLSIAQMDAKTGDRSGLGPIDLTEVVRGIAELYQPVAEDCARTLHVQLPPRAMILGDAQLMAQMVSNLIENGLKYTREGDQIEVTVTQQDQRVRLRVADTEPGLDPDMRDALFTPFSRGSGRADTTPGHGLGLSLVQAIALRHGAVLRVPLAEKGFALEIDCLQFRGIEVSD